MLPISVIHFKGREWISNVCQIWTDSEVTLWLVQHFVFKSQSLILTTPWCRHWSSSELTCTNLVTFVLEYFHLANFDSNLCQNKQMQHSAFTTNSGTDLNNLHLSNHSVTGKLFLLPSVWRSFHLLESAMNNIQILKSPVYLRS